jgi:hypothetical protein
MTGLAAPAAIRALSESDRRRQAALTVCRHARDTADARLLLDVLGLLDDPAVDGTLGLVAVDELDVDAAPLVEVDVPDLDDTAHDELPDVQPADEKPAATHRRTRRPCVDCGRITVAQTEWRDMTEAEKEGVALRAAHGMCWSCYGRAQRARTLPHPAPPGALRHGPKPGPPRPCVDCRRLTVNAKTWARMSVAERDGKTVRGAHGMCSACCARARAHGTLPNPAPREQPAAAEPAEPVVDMDELASEIDVAPSEVDAPEPAPEPPADMPAGTTSCACGRLAVAHGQCGFCIAERKPAEPAEPAEPVDDLPLVQPAEPDDEDAADEDAITRALVPVVLNLIGAVHARDATAVAAAFEQAGVLRDDPLAAARHLAVVAAEMCSEHLAAQVALGWALDTNQDNRSSTDALRAGRTTEH